jgi:NitT/TauT family transport system substrate-binding protein/putative hydroxymethylpyrimidine transport system substrate-binding protein
MRRVAASLAAVVCALAAAGCQDDGAEPDAPVGATLVLDFQPNAVHSGIYAAQHRGYFEDEGIDLTIREPSSTSDAPSLLEAGRADLAVMDINDFVIARERGADLVAIAAIVQRPLASVIAGDGNEVRTPADLAGMTVGVTGVPSDDAVLDTVLASAGLAPDSVERIEIGFNAVSALAAERIDAATAFWNAEGVQLRELGFPTREFRVDEFGAPRYPELVLVTRADEDQVAERALAGTTRGYETLGEDPQGALEDLLAEVPGLDPASQAAQLDALTSSDAFALDGAAATPELDQESVERWRRWARENGVLGG